MRLPRSVPFDHDQEAAMTVETVCCHGSNRIANTNEVPVGYMVKVDGATKYFNLAGHFLTMELTKAADGTVTSLRIMDGDEEAAPLPDGHPYQVTLDDEMRPLVCEPARSP
jgi:hypothetical protein